MLYGFTYDGRHSSEFNLTVTSVRRKLHAPIKPRLVSVPQKPGAYNYGKPEIGHLVFEVSVLFTAQDNRPFHDLRRDIAAWLYRDEEVELVFDEEPDKYYMAQFSEESDIDRLGTAGSTTLYFVSSDPYAFGKTKTQRIANPYVVFQREGIRYREDGTEVTEHYPVYKPGKFDQAILVEEGTENLLPSASAPVQEEMSLSPSDEYYLTTIGGSATIEHKKVEEINRTLDKEGQDYSETNDTDWEGGTHTNTEEVNDDFLQLKHAGTPHDHSWDEKAEWEATGNLFENAIADDNGRLVINQPISFSIEDDMSNYSATNWQAYGDTSLITQEPGKVRIETQTAPSQETGIYRNHGVNFTQATIFFSVNSQYTSGNPSFWITNGTKGYLFTIPNTSGQIVPFYIRIISDTEVEYYGGISKIPESYYAIYDNTSTPQFRFYVNNPDTGTLEIEQFYFVDQLVDIPPMSGTSYWTGRWRTPFIDLSDVGTIESAFAEWEVGYTGDIPSFVYSDILYQLRIDGVEQDWKILHEGYDTGTFSVDIPDLPKGTDASSIEIRLQAELHSFDPVWKTYLNYLRMAVIPAYHTSGHRDSPEITGIRQVGKAAQTSVSWNINDQPTGTSVKVYTRHSLDDGATWTDWAEVANSGDPIPGIAQATDLTNARLQYRVELGTTDTSVTPSVDSLSISLTSGYKPSQTFTLTPIDVSSIGEVADSAMNWTANTPSGTSVAIEASIDGSDWSPVTNGGSFITSGTDLTGKSLYIRYTLTTSDTRYTPTMQPLEWRIAQAEPNRIKPATGVIVLTPNNADRWQLEHRPYPTGWHAYGTRRNDETAYVPIELKAKGTIELWAYEDIYDMQKNRFIFDGGGILSFRKATDNNYVLTVNGSGALTIAPPSAGWHYWAVRWNDDAVDVFLDGESVATFPLEEPLNFETVDRLFIGCSEAGAQWNGLLDDLRVSFAARSDEEIAAAFASGKPAEADDRTDYKFAFDGSLAPTVSKTFEIGGTAPTQGIFTATFINKAPYFKISNEIEYVQVDVEFEPGDILEIDCVREVVRKNSSRLEAMPFVHLDSDFFDLIPGGTVFVEPEGAAKVDATFTERWR